MVKGKHVINILLFILAVAMAIAIIALIAHVMEERSFNPSYVKLEGDGDDIIVQPIAIRGDVLIDREYGKDVTIRKEGASAEVRLHNPRKGELIRVIDKENNFTISRNIVQCSNTTENGAQCENPYLK